VERVASELEHVVDAASLRLKTFEEADTTARPVSDEWSKKEILGHLVDSATNNHHRFVRAQQAEELVFPQYEQEDWVRLQDYNSTSWESLIELWRLYNHHLAHVIRHISADRLGVICRIGPHEPVTLGYLVEDYLVHLKNHLRQLGL
jgi:hypothetical protein